MDTKQKSKQNSKKINNNTSLMEIVYLGKKQGIAAYESLKLKGYILHSDEYFL